jgi:hypothetical protein
LNVVCVCGIFEQADIKPVINAGMKSILRFLFYILTFSIILTSIGCSSSSKLESADAADILGSWELYDQSGVIQDVCSKETLGFTKDGKAVLQCPGSKPIIRLYSIKNGILTYTETGIKFKFNIKSENSVTRLELYGQNVGRNLFYKKINKSTSNTGEKQTP